MKSRLVKILGITLLTCMLGGCTATTQTNPMETAETVAETAADTVVTAKTRTKDIAVLYTGDVHCAINENIGYAGLAAYKNQLSADGSEVILVDSGDAIQGAMIGSYSQGESIIKLMNEIGYSALNLGNHEFDYGGIQRVEELSKIATFPFLSLNFIEIETGKPVFNPYTIVESDGVKIAFIGVSTPKTITSSTPTYFMDQNNNFLYDFMRDESGETLWEGIQNTIDEVRREGADYIVALSHLGISDPVFSSCNMIANTTGIDAVLDGHSHSVIECERVKNSEGNRILLTATGTKLEHIGMLLIDRNGNLSTGLISDITEKDSKIEATITELETEYQEEMSKVAAHLKSDLVVNNPITDERIVRNAETNLGDLCADAYRTAGNSDVAFINGGGVRASLSSGDVTKEEILSVNPFGNLLCKREVTGQVILDALEFGTRLLPEESGSFLQVSGLTYEIHADLPSSVVTDEDGMFVSIDGEYRVQNVMIAGEPIDVDKMYTVVAPNYFLKNFGDGFTMFNSGELLMEDFMLDADALIEYFNNEYRDCSDSYQNSYGEGRINAARK